MPRTAWVAIGVGVAIAIGLLAWFMPSSVAPLESPEYPNVILITVDTLRADHLSCYGYPRDTSPSIDQLAEDSLVLDNAVTPSPSTGPSVASMMTSSYPYQHGVVHNFYQLHDQNLTVAETLQQNSYVTAAFVSNYVLVGDLSNLHQGFDVFDDYLSERELNRDVYERSATGTVNMASAWLQNIESDPFFLWLHLMDPHGPYTPPPPFDHEFMGTPELLQRELIPDYQFLGSLDRAFYVDRYDGEIAYCDQQIGRFLDTLRSLGLYDDALVVLHADHGESLGEHGRYFEHGVDVFEPCLRIPMLVKLPRELAVRSAWPSRSDVLVSVMDIAPTILDVAGVSRPSHYVGRSLRAILDGGGLADRHVFVEAHLPDPQGGQLIGVRTSDRKLVVRTESRRDLTVLSEGYYVLSADPREERDVSATEDAVRTELREILLAHREMLAVHRFPFKRTNYRPDDGRAFMDQHNRGRLNESNRAHYQALKSLGYIE